MGAELAIWRLRGRGSVEFGPPLWKNAASFLKAVPQVQKTQPRPITSAGVHE